ncbi:MAG TPA: SDR family oxidoreductase [Phycisphaerales bacterium]|nr:SDR family oxidoreductase [Phycisphaerales bacterium]
MEHIQPKRVLLTGCSSGFGLLTAIHAAQAGYEVIATLRNPAKKTALNEALRQAGATARVEILDVTDPASIQEVLDRIGPVDVLVNNAGILVMGSFLDVTDAEAQRVWQTNYFGPVALARAVAPGMIQRRRGLIINVASLAGLVGHPFNAAYAASKHALIGFSRSIRMELRPFGVRVVSVEPGYHKTEIIRANATLSEHFYDRQSPFFEWNRGFLRLMMDRVIPKAAGPEAVAEQIVRIIGMDRPRPHYVLGRDARWACRLQRLGLGAWLEKEVYSRLRRAVRQENRRESEKKARRRKTNTGSPPAHPEPPAPRTEGQALAK